MSDRIVYLVDDDEAIRRSAGFMLKTSGFKVTSFASGLDLLKESKELPPGCILLDVRMPDMDGLQVQQSLKDRGIGFPVIVMTATHDLETAVQCMQAGAIDYLAKPVDNNRLVSSVRRALELRALREEVISLKERLLSDTPHQPEAFAEIVTQNQTMQALFRYVEAIARSPQPVLITGAAWPALG